MLADGLCAFVVGCVVTGDQILEAGVAIRRVAALEQPLGQKLQVHHEPLVVHRAFVKGYAVVGLGVVDHLADQLGDGNHVRHAAVQLGVHDMKRYESGFVLGQPQAQHAFDHVQRLLAQCVFLGIEVFDLPEQLVGVFHPVPEPLHRKGDMVRKGDIHIFTKPPPQHPLGGFDDVGADVQIFAGNILHQLHQSVALAGIPQGVDLFHPGGGQKISGRFF